MKQQQDSNRQPGDVNPQGNQQRPRPQDQDGQSSANPGGRQDQNPDRSRDKNEDASPEGQGRPRQPGSDASDPGVDQDSDSAGIGKEGQGGQSQRPQNPARER
ncbi:MAG TPA: hypothetical protein VFO28_10520 [Burkholderiaceae bacterium]|nr:hypothetical protein [Burkholderiaceae bacterium]